MLPHHHHEQEVCFVKIHCSDELDDYHAGKSEHKGVGHDHHNSKTDYCQINNYYLAPDGKSFSTKFKIKSFNNNLFVNTHFENKITSLFSDFIPENILKRDQPGLNSKCLTRALRAPPFC